MIRRTTIAVMLAMTPAALSAQHSFSTDNSYDAAVPTPRSVLGYDVGDRFTPHHMMMRYIDRVAATSKRVRVDTVGR
ncbi:MAG TPA: hypothetical protein VFB46_11745, partial [Gemmatimonadaceae bacterium]|nr:hypothetical protein [Gemmatimonadaceae bacterium]